MFFYKKRSVHGLLLLDKPQGISSNNALQKVKIIFNAKKAGYIGTLDPLATGMLPICFGECTKFSDYLMQSNKRYHVIAKLGEKTSTSDSNGVIIKKRPILFNSSQLKSSIDQLIGVIHQMPSMYSAIKYQGLPLYKYARKGLNIERKTRKIIVHNIYSLYQEKNLIEFKILCSKGTYIRTLIDDLGEKLGCGAHVIFLRRLQVASYLHNQLVTLPSLYELLNTNYINDVIFFKKLDSLLMSIDSPVSFLPKVYLSIKQSYNFKLGQAVKFTSDITNGLVRVIEENNKFIGLGKIKSRELLTPYRLVSI
ncbi:tRNA pseudouridine(55) synthase TruB [Buchnera aphidicola (Macrosiphoniella sanborni)]|uniref:tRNA pseudouridine synthase B n=1 Tax=Buchnera aphidicola (Macrosiphoniella sanborni) TaxID=1241865 RepID=A0A4D6Y2W9_9GAMM|nr:tRNA pseudouridine(55) synthase TruB [Buchnera aphidicola]QCI23902.1 tRNA pseudouridine(55) synthase TruB [Buchnera aphidicola (Macrosiphoniella sanborni)]